MVTTKARKTHFVNFFCTLAGVWLSKPFVKREGARDRERERDLKLVISLSGREGLLAVYRLHTETCTRTHTPHEVLVILCHFGFKHTIQMEEHKEHLWATRGEKKKQ